MKRKRRKGGEIFGDGKNIFAEEKKTEEENIKLLRTDGWNIEGSITGPCGQKRIKFKIFELQKNIHIFGLQEPELLVVLFSSSS